VLAALAVAAAQTRPPAPKPSGEGAREQAYRANNIGVAYLEQYDFAAATTAFRQALAADAGLAIARLNLGIALFYGGDAKAARTELEAARTALPGRPEPDYVLGLIARAEDRVEDAMAAFARVRAIDPADAGAATNLGQLYLQQRDYPKAIEVLRAAAAAEPYNATAAYGLATALTRSNDPDARAAMDRFQTLRGSGYAITYSQAYLEQGRYGEAIASTGAEPDLVDTATPDVAFADATASALVASTGRAGGSTGPAIQGAGGRASSPATDVGRGVSPAEGAVTLADLDGDGDLDLIDGGGSALRVLRNQRGRFTDVSASWFGGAAIAPAAGAIAGDYDNDGRADLLVLRGTGVTLYRQSAAGRFQDATGAAKLDDVAKQPAGRTAAWVDADHDGDLDLFVSFAAAGTTAGDGNALLRNNGDGTFTDITAQAGVAAQRPLTATVPTDFDNRRDIDLLAAGPAGNPLLFRNMRDGTFKDVAASVGLTVTGTISCVAAGDINKDGSPDFFFGHADAAGTLALSDGRGAFKTTSLAPAADALAAQVLDYDADGLLDLLLVTNQGPRMVRNIGSGWSDVTARA
jgi:Tfp pilus assembly protein PilF